MGWVLPCQRYYPFGHALRGTNPIQPNPDYHYAYNGKEKISGTGLYAYGFRYYHPLTARFTGVDPISDQFAFVSVYNYAENSPIANIDLHGLQAFSTISGAHMAEAMYPERAKGLGAAAWKYELYSSAGTVTVIAGFLGIAYAPQAATAVMSSPTLAPSIGAGLWGLGTDADIPGFGDDITRLGRNAIGSFDGRGGSLSKFLSGVNVNPSKRGGINCTSCAHAVDQRLDGNLSAVSLPNGVVNPFGGKSFLESIYGKPTTITSKFGDIVNQLDGLGDGAKGVVVASGGGKRAGHAFNVVRQRGAVKILDGQTEKEYTMDQFRGYLNGISENSTYYFYDTTK